MSWKGKCKLDQYVPDKGDIQGVKVIKIEVDEEYGRVSYMPGDHHLGETQESIHRDMCRECEARRNET